MSFHNYVRQTLQPAWLADWKISLVSDFVLLGGPPAIRSSMINDERRSSLFTASCTVDYWQGWLTAADSLHWWGSLIYIPVEQTSWVRPSESDRHPLLPPSPPVLLLRRFSEETYHLPTHFHSLHLKNKRGIKPLILSSVEDLLSSPDSSKATQILLFLQLLCMFSPPFQALCVCDPADLMFPPWSL